MNPVCARGTAQSGWGQVGTDVGGTMQLHDLVTPAVVWRLAGAASSERMLAEVVL